MKKHIKYLLITLIILIGIINCTKPNNVTRDKITEIYSLYTVDSTVAKLNVYWKTENEVIADETSFEVTLGDVHGTFYKGSTREKSVSVNHAVADSLHIQIVTKPYNDTIIPKPKSIIINDVQAWDLP